MKKTMFPVFLCIILTITSVLGQSPPVHAAVVSDVSSPSTDSSGNVTWDCIYFGNYWQSDNNGDGKADQTDAKEPIKWRVLSAGDKKAILMSEQILDACKFNDKTQGDVPCSWETSSVRTWLNQTFYNDAFSSAEQNIIQTSTVNDVNNPSTGQEGGGATEDKVYLLSIADAIKEEYGFDAELKAESETRAATATAYASAYYNLKGWYLLTRGLTQKDTVYVKNQGTIDNWGYNSYITEGIRPVICIDLGSSSLWEYAGTVEAAKKPATTPAPVQTNKPTAQKTPSASQKPTATAKPTVTPSPKITPVPKKPAPATTMKPGTKKAISSYKDLQDMEKIPSGNYYLKKDITVPKNARIFCDYPFTGTLDGRGHKIKGYTVSKTIVSGPLQENNVYNELADTSWVLVSPQTRFGLFDQASKATFKNISMAKVKITVKTDCVASRGSLVTDANSCTFQNVHTSGQISVKSTRENPLAYSSVVIGSGKMVNCSNSTKITADIMNGYDSNGDFVGGLAGNFSYSLLKNCSNSGNLSLSGYGSMRLVSNPWFGVADLTMGTPLNKAGNTKAKKTGKKMSLINCSNSGSITLKPTARGKSRYDTSVYGLTDLHEEIWCNTLFAVGLVSVTRNMESCSNTGKIKASNSFAKGTVYAAGLAGRGEGKLSRCYNKGSISFNGYLIKESHRNEVAVGGLFAEKWGGKREVTAECYNKGNIKVKIKNKEKKTMLRHQTSIVSVVL